MSDDELTLIPQIAEETDLADEPPRVVTWPKPNTVSETVTDIVVAKTPLEPIMTRLSGCAVPISILCAAVLIAASILMSGGGGAAPPHNDLIFETIDETTPIIDSVDAGDLKQCSLIVIADGSLENEDVDYATTLQDDTFWDAAAARVKDVEILSPKDAIAAKFLEATRQTPPIVFLLKADKHPAWVIPLPKGGTKPIQEKLDGR